MLKEKITVRIQPRTDLILSELAELTQLSKAALIRYITERYVDDRIIDAEGFIRADIVNNAKKWWQDNAPLHFALSVDNERCA